jgi:hypothetical protein
MTSKSRDGSAPRSAPADPRLRGGNGGEDSTFQAITVATIRKGEAELRITLDRFKGRYVVDVRQWESFTPARVFMATKRGVTLAVVRLPELAKALAEAERHARELGLMGGEQ